LIYTIESIRHVHLEISSFCNARCPLCPRNFYGYPFNDGYVEHNMSLAEAKQIFEPNFIQQLDELYINGNFGDAIMNPETVSIVKYFQEYNSKLKIRISTNAGARNKQFWKDLAKLGTEIHFCIDGLEDTHSLYRQNTKYKTVLNNAKIFIAAGGHAVWKMIKFDHNQHQIDQARALSTQLQFKKFNLVDNGRNQGPVFDKNKKLVHVMGQVQTVNFDKLFWSRTNNEVLLEDITPGRVPLPIVCAVKKSKSLYVSSTGEIYPCCFLGFNPKNYGHGNYHAAANSQLAPLIDKNNALKYSLRECISWFNQVENTWNIPTFEQGRLIICNDVCGQKQ
jgi:MoaA/NifB/PqqE/SkfB family radical SAM enzyme